MMQVMQIAFLASPPLKNHLQHNLKKPSIRPPSSPSMCRVYVYLLRATPPRPPNYFVRQAQLSWRLLRRLSFVTKQAAKTKRQQKQKCCKSKKETHTQNLKKKTHLKKTQKIHTQKSSLCLVDMFLYRGEPHRTVFLRG